MFNNYFIDCAGFISITKRELPSKFMMPNIKFHGIENPHHHIRNFVSTMTQKGIDSNIFHIIFTWTFDKVEMR